MTYTAKVTFKYDSTWEHKIGSTFGEDILPEEHVTYEFPVEDATSYQMFRAFGKFMYMVGHNQEGIARGAASVAFGEDRSTADMQKTADYFDLILAEVHGKKVIELEDKIYAQEQEIRDLKAKLSRFEQPDNAQYTDEEMDAMTSEEYNALNNLVPGSYAAVQNGCKCPVMDNEEMPDDKKWVNGDCPLHGKVK
jgi:hypothetical protein